jgi:hypothetical protein
MPLPAVTMTSLCHCQLAEPRQLQRVLASCSARRPDRRRGSYPLRYCPREPPRLVVDLVLI